MNKKNWQSEKGNAALVAVIFIGFIALAILTSYGMKNFRGLRSLEKSRSVLSEKWQARSQANKLSQIVKIATPKKFNEDVRLARANCGASVQMRLFDAETIASGESRPLARFNDGGALQCQDTSSSTSVFGSFSKWRDTRQQYLQNEAVDVFQIDSNTSRIVEFQEIYRRSFGSESSDIAYAVRYIVESKIGQYRTRVNGEIILGSDLATCGTLTTLDVAPATVEKGQNVTLNITYSYANKLVVYNSANVLVHSVNVTEQSSNQVYSYTFAPAVTDNYRVVASGSGSCQAVSATTLITVTDPPPVCPSITSAFTSSSVLVNSGENFTLTWNVGDANDLRLEGVPVAFNGNLTTSITADRSYTLVASKTGCSDVIQVVNVSVRPPTPCTFSNPSIQSFSATNASITPGATTSLSWNVSGLETGSEITVSGNGLNQTVSNTGSINITPPNAVGDYIYTLAASNKCADGTLRTSTATVTIQSRNCPSPVIDAFSVNPTTASAGIGTVRFSWLISGTADAVSISNGVGGGLPSSGFVDISTPNTGGNFSYTLTTVGCGQTRTSTITLTVNACNPPVINSFTVNPAIVTQGGNQTVTLQWSATADCGGTATIDNGIGAVPLSGSVNIAQPQTTTTYTLTVTSPGGTVTSQKTITVNPPLPPTPVCSSSGYTLGYRITSPFGQTNGAYMFSGSFELMSDGKIKVSLSSGMGRVNGVGNNVSFTSQATIYDYNTDAPLSQFSFSGSSDALASIVGFPQMVTPTNSNIGSSNYVIVVTNVGGQIYNSFPGKVNQFGQPVYFMNCP